MGFPRQQIKANSRAALSAHYWPVVGIVFLAQILASVLTLIAAVPTYVAEFSAIASGDIYAEAAATAGAGMGSSLLQFIGIFVSLFFEVGLAYFCYTVYRGDEPDLGNIFIAFKDGNFGRVLGGMLLVTIYTFLWSLLFIIPGIIKSYQYSMMPYLLIDRKDLSIKECFAMSKKMTDGYKGSLFVLQLSFIGWAILSVFTFGILDIFFVDPYYNLAYAGAYDYLKRTRMDDINQTNGFTEQPVFQTASYDADYTSNSAEPQNTTESNNDNIFDE